MKKAFITGGSSGIGKAFAERLAKMGYEVMLVARTEDKLREAIASLPKANGQKHAFLAADLSEKEGRDAALAELRKTKYDILVNNAGIGGGFGFAEVPLEKLEAMIELNCSSLMALSHAYLQNAVAGDAIINIGSIVSFVPYPGLAAYSATKAFVLSLSESLYQIYGKKGIHVMAVCPGTTDTNFFRAAGDAENASLDMAAKQAPTEVADEAFRALKKKKLYVVTGSANKAIAFFGRHLPPKLLLFFAEKW